MHHNIYCVARSPFAFWDIISLPICIWGYPFAHHIRDIAPHLPLPLVLSLPIWISFHLCLGYPLIPVCIQGLYDMRSPYAYGDQDQSTYAYGDRSNPRIHTGVKINPRMHTRIACHVIPVCILGLICNPRMHMGIFAIPVCIRGSDGH